MKYLYSSKGSIRFILLGTIVLIIALFSVVKVKSVSLIPSNLSSQVVPVTVARAEPVPAPKQLELNGEAISVNPLEVYFPFDGFFVSATVKDKQRVSKNDLLLQLNYNVDSSKLAELEGKLKADQAAIQKKSDLPTTAEEWKVHRAAKLQLAQLESEINILKQKIDATQMRAPLSGVVELPKYSTGQIIKTGDLALKINPLATEYLYFKLPLKYTGNIKLGDSLEYSMQGSPLKYKAVILGFLPVQDYFSSNHLVECLPDKTDRNIKAGSKVVFQLKNSIGAEVLRVPNQAILSAVATPKLYAVQNINHGRKVDYYFSDPRFIITGGQSEDGTYVLSGLEANELVALQGVKQLQNFMRVEILNEF